MCTQAFFTYQTSKHLSLNTETDGEEGQRYTLEQTYRHEGYQNSKQKTKNGYGQRHEYVGTQS